MAKVVVLRRHAHNQVSPSNTWTINHNLNVISPVVDVWIKQLDGTYINSDAHEVDFTSPNQIVVTFNGATTPPSGTACVT